MERRSPGRVLILSLVALTLVACSSGAPDAGPTGPETAAEIPAGATATTFEVVEEVSSPMSGIEDRRRLVIRDSGTWSDFWSELAARVEPAPPVPEIDFGTSMIIAAAMGQRTSGGYEISVEEVAEKDGKLYARVQETSPGAACMTITVMTAPVVAVVVPRHEGPVAFVEAELALPCAP